MSSRFKGIFDTAKETEAKAATKIFKQPKKEPTVRAVSIPTVPEKITRKKGTGKSSNPHYTQALVYVRKDTLQKVREYLFFDPTQDFSDLVETLLNSWTEKRK